MHTLTQHFKKFIAENNLQQQQSGVAVSGGIDSIVLCELCHQAGVHFFIVHCNFGLRGAESNRDEQFVRSVAEKYEVPILVKHFDTEKYAAENKLSIQEAARDLRYQWFEELHQQDKADYILLAHHANDNIETLLMNFFRGTGLEGLTGMPWRMYYRFCLRPLLSFFRKDIEAFAQQYHLSWVEDSSNQSNKYTRNYFRNELIPALKKIYPQVEENLLDNIERFQKTANLYNLCVNELKEKIGEGNFPEVRIPVLKLMKYQHTSLIYEIIKPYGFGEKQVEEVIKLANSDSGKYIANEAYQIIKHRRWFIISPVFVPAQTIAVEKETSVVRLTHGFLELNFTGIKKFQLNDSKKVAQLDARKVKFPLLVRQWRQGDYFYPLGMHKKKKLARFFIDAKLSKNEKEKVWVVESDKKIVWVVGHRIDDRFKISAETKEVVELRFREE